MAYTLAEFDEYLNKKCYPPSCKGNSGRKKNFRRAVEKFHLREGVLHRIVKIGNEESSLRVIKDEKEREDIVLGAHVGFDDTSVESKALGGHLGYDKTEKKIASKVWWPCIRKDVRNYIKSCIRCQRRAPCIKRGPKQAKKRPHPWSQIGVDICSLPASKEGYTCLVVAVDCFSKWTEAEALYRKAAEGVADFLYGCICRHGYFDIQINDSCCEFVNSVSTELLRLTGVKVKVTSPYHLQANGLVKPSPITNQDMMTKVFSEASLAEDWPRALPGILFALRTSTQASTKHSPFFLMYGREPKQPEPMALTEQQFPTNSNEWADSGQQCLNYETGEIQTVSECVSSEQQFADKTQVELQKFFFNSQ
ncbi:hypothetical protein EGW08_020564 [Elysia chlorotica]|uniref:Integrase catalytic domain-containing protein n=1 Tax=Elysia chlorotica TaxID=188477 RepID=A0A3S0ZCA5_ELYCH|nr:hypothetical protein EGW08_020564 [Elysia chlorotica]